MPVVALYTKLAATSGQPLVKEARRAEVQLRYGGVRAGCVRPKKYSTESSRRGVVADGADATRDVRREEVGWQGRGAGSQEGDVVGVDGRVLKFCQNLDQRGLGRPPSHSQPRHVSSCTRQTDPSSEETYVDGEDGVVISALPPCVVGRGWRPGGRW